MLYLKSEIRRLSITSSKMAKIENTNCSSLKAIWKMKLCKKVKVKIINYQIMAVALIFQIIFK